MDRKRKFNRFLLLWSGELVSSIGSGLTSFGLGVYVFRQTGSAADMALVSLLAFLPTLLLSVPAGVLADRCDRRGAGSRRCHYGLRGAAWRHGPGDLSHQSGA